MKNIRYKTLFFYITIMICCLLPIFLSAQTHDLKHDVNIKNLNLKSIAKDKNYIYFDEDSLHNNVGRVVVNLNTLSQTNIVVNWQNSFAKKNRTKWFVRLQYRLNEQDEWIDVKDKRGKSIEFTTTYKRYSKNFNDIALPQECENKDFIQIAWYIDTYAKNKDSYPEILFHNILICSNYDKYFGKEAIVKVYKAQDEDKRPLQNITFDKIPLPFIFPPAERITIEGKNIRDSIILRIEGEDASAFSLSSSSINEKQSIGKIISVNYVPKKEGRHRATLIVETKKLHSNIEIPIEGSCAKHIPYNENMLPNSAIAQKTSSFSYHIPVFSSTEYQYSFSQNSKHVQTIYITYRWYREQTLIYDMHDTTNSIQYCAPLISPKNATSLDIALKALDKIDFEDYYFGNQKIKTMVRSGYWSDETNWEKNRLPNVEDFVVIANGVRATVDKDVSCSMLILGDSANVNINTGKIFYVANDIFYGKNAWCSVHQYLLPSRWNYISSPINQAHSAIFSMKNASSGNDSWFMKYNTGILSKHDDYWSEYITDPKFTLKPGIGYAVYTHEPLDVKYEGLLCNSTVSIPLVSTPKDKWNLIGNCYTAPLSSKKLFEDIDGRIQGNVILLFDIKTKIYNPIIIDNKEEVMIPSLESFFVEALDKPSEIMLKRSQQYIPLTTEQVWTNNNYLKLSVFKGKDWQYVLLGMDDRAEYGFDDMDCHKIYGNSETMPDVYLSDGNDEYSVNVFPSYPASYDVGLYIGSDADVELSINNLSIMPDYVMIFLEDKETGEFIDFCSDGKIDVPLKSGNTNKFKIHIIKSLDYETNENNIFVWQDGERILFYSPNYVKISKYKITKNSQTIIEEDYNGGVISNKINKDRYKISFLSQGKWSKERDLIVK